MFCYNDQVRFWSEIGENCSHCVRPSLGGGGGVGSMRYTEAQILIVSLSFKVYSSFAFWTTFAIIHIFGCLYLSSQIYYMGRVKFGEFWIVNVEVYLVILGIVLVRICLIYDSIENILL